MEWIVHNKRVPQARPWPRSASEKLAGKEVARDFDLKDAKFDFLLTCKNKIEGVLLWPLQYKRLTLDANNLVQMHEGRQGSNPPRVCMATRITPQPFRLCKPYLLCSIEFPRLIAENRTAKRDGVPSIDFCPSKFQKHPSPEISRNSKPCDRCNVTFTYSHNLKYGIIPQAHQHILELSQHKIMQFGNVWSPWHKYGIRVV